MSCCMWPWLRKVDAPRKNDMMLCAYTLALSMTAARDHLRSQTEFLVLSGGAQHHGEIIQMQETITLAAPIHRLLRQFNCTRPTTSTRRDCLIPQEECEGFSRPPYLPRHARIALQNEDQVEDIIVITKLDTIPFCCHEELLAMSRDKLVAVARSLNAKLPASMKIDVSPDRPDIFIRHSVEFLVGIRRTVPRAPKAIKMQSDVECVDFDASPPSSPLATKTRRAYDARIARERTKLHRLDEEEGTAVFERPSKIRRLYSNNVGLRSASMHGDVAGSSPGKILSPSAFSRRTIGARTADWKSTTTGGKSRGSLSRAQRYNPNARLEEHGGGLNILRKRRQTAFCPVRTGRNIIPGINYPSGLGINFPPTS